MVLEPILCPCCQTDDVVKCGQSGEGKQRYQCRNSDCSRQTFILDYSYRVYLPEVKDQISDMPMNSSGIQDTARVLRISPTTVIKMIKKSPRLKAINEKVLAQIQPSHTIVML